MFSAVSQGERHHVLTFDIDCELVEGMHRSMQLDIALGAMDHALPGGCSHADAISQAGQLLRPISAQHIYHLLVLHRPHDNCTLAIQQQKCVSDRVSGTCSKMIMAVAANDNANSTLHPWCAGL